MLNENDVVAAVCEYLKREGFQILQQCHTTEQGVDIVAQHHQLGRLLVEAKGATSARLGSERFDKGFNAGQVRHQVAHAFYKAACMLETSKAGEQVAMAFPDTPLFRTYIGRIQNAAKKLQLAVLLVRPEKSVQRLQ